MARPKSADGTVRHFILEPEIRDKMLEIVYERKFPAGVMFENFLSGRSGKKIKHYSENERASIRTYILGNDLDKERPVRRNGNAVMATLRMTEKGVDMLYMEVEKEHKMPSTIIRKWILDGMPLYDESLLPKNTQFFFNPTGYHGGRRQSEKKVSDTKRVSCYIAYQTQKELYKYLGKYKGRQVQTTDIFNYVIDNIDDFLEKTDALERAKDRVQAGRIGINSVNLYFRLTEERKNKLTVFCKEHQISISSFVQEVLISVIDGEYEPEYPGQGKSE